MSSRRQKLLTRVIWYLQSSLKHIAEEITGNKFYKRGGRYRQVSFQYTFLEFHGFRPRGQRYLTKFEQILYLINFICNILITNNWTIVQGACVNRLKKIKFVYVRFINILLSCNRTFTWVGWKGFIPIIGLSHNLYRHLRWNNGRID